MNNLLPYTVTDDGDEEGGGGLQEMAVRVLQQESPVLLVGLLRRLDHAMHNFKYRPLGESTLLQLVRHLLAVLQQLSGYSRNNDDDNNDNSADTVQLSKASNTFQVQNVELCAVVMQSLCQLMDQYAWRYRCQHQQQLQSDLQIDARMFLWLLKQYENGALSQLLPLVTRMRRHFLPETLDLNVMLQDVQLAHLSQLVKAHSVLCLMMPTSEYGVKQRVTRSWLKAVHSLISLKALDLNYMDWVSRLVVDQFPAAVLEQQEDKMVLLAMVTKWIKLPIGSGLGATWNVGAKNVLSNTQYVNNSIKQYDHAASQFIKYRRDCYKSAAMLIVYGGVEIALLKQWFGAVETFLHPSNNGAWTIQICKLLHALCETLHSRVRMESMRMVSYGAEQYLNKASVREYADLLLPLVEMAAWGKDGKSVQYAVGSIRNLAWLEPQLVQEIVQRVLPSLQAASELSHRTTGALQILGQLSMPLLHRLHCAGGYEVLGAALTSVIPGIDMNDPTKAMYSLMFFAQVFTVVPLHEVPMVAVTDQMVKRVQSFQQPLYPVVAVTRESLEQQLAVSHQLSQVLSDVLHQLLAAVTVLVENMPHQSDTGHGSVEGNIQHTIVFLFDILLRQCSRANLAVVERWLLKMVELRVYTFTKPLARIVELYLNLQPASVTLFVEYLRVSIDKELEYGAGGVPSAQKLSFENENAAQGRHVDASLWFHLQLLRACMNCASVGQQSALCVKLVSELWLKCQSRTCYGVVSRMFRGLLFSSGYTYLMEHGVLASDATTTQIIDESWVWGVSPYERVCHHLQVPLGTFLKTRKDHEYKMETHTPVQELSFWQAMRQQLDIKWHVPAEQEKQFVVDTVQHFAQPLIDRLLMQMNTTMPVSPGTAKHDDTVNAMCKDLTLLYHLLQGVAGLVAPDPESLLSTKDTPRDRYQSVTTASVVEDDTSTDDASIDDDLMDSMMSLDDGAHEDGEDSGGGDSLRKPLAAAYAFTDPDSPQYKYLVQLRVRIGQLVLELVEHIHAKHEDDVECMHLLIKIIHTYIVDRGLEKSRLQDYQHAYKFTKRILRVGSQREYKMYGLYAFQKRIQLLQLTRMAQNSVCDHGNLGDQRVYSQFMQALHTMATSRYGDVRIEAQHCINSAVKSFRSAKNGILDCTFDMLDKSLRVALDTTVDDKALLTTNDNVIKGCLHLLLCKSFIGSCRRNWKYVARFMSAIIVACKLDKQSLQELVRSVYAHTISKFSRVPIEVPALNAVMKHDEQFSASQERKRVDNVAIYNQILRQLVQQLSHDGHWRVKVVILSMIALIMRPDQPVRGDVAQALLKCTADESLFVRQMSLQYLVVLMQDIKLRFIKQMLPTLPYKAVIESKDYKSTEHFLDNSVIGWMYQPKQIKVYKQAGLQNSQVLYADTASQDAAATLKAELLSPAFLTLFFNNVSQETTSNSRATKPGDEQFSLTHVRFYKYMFQFYQDAVLYDVMLPIVEPWIKAFESKPLQRASAEFVTGLLVGSKLWPEAMKLKLWTRMVPLLKMAMLSCTPESHGNWYHCMSLVMDRCDPARLKPVFDLLLNDRQFKLDINSDSAFGEYKKLSLVRLIIQKYNWRVSGIAEQLITEYAQFSGHRYKQVREQVSAILSDCTMACVRPKSVASTDMNVFIVEADNMGTLSEVARKAISVSIGMMRQEKLKLNGALAYGSPFSHCAKTVMQWLNEQCQSGRAQFVLPMLLDSQQPLLLDLFQLQTTDDQDLSTFAAGMLTYIPNIQFPQEHAVHWLNTFVAIVSNNLVVQSNAAEDETTRRTKLRLLAMLQILAFRHIFSVWSGGDLSTKVLNSVMQLAVDQLLEVRILASITLSGLLRLFGVGDSSPVIMAFIQQCKKWLAVKLNKDTIAIRHAGVLGFASLVQAFPYSVPTWLPELLVNVSRHAKDPSPIDTSVRQIFADFRRTHQDTWQDDVLNGAQNDYTELYGYGTEAVQSGGQASSHRQVGATVKGHFTSEQLEMLEGLLTSSASYYA